MKVWRSEPESSTDDSAAAVAAGGDAAAPTGQAATPTGEAAVDPIGERLRVPVHSAHVRAAVEAAEAAGTGPSGALMRRQAC